MLRKLLAFAALSSLLACSSSSGTGSATVSGTVGGFALAVAPGTYSLSGCGSGSGRYATASFINTDETCEGLATRSTGLDPDRAADRPRRARARANVRLRMAAAAAVCLAAAACGSGSAWEATISAPINGIQLSPVEVEGFNAAVPACAGASAYNVVGVAMSDRAGMCAATESSANLAGSTQLIFQIQSQSGAITTGNYTANDPAFQSGPLVVTAQFEKFDSHCEGTPYYAHDGTISLSAVNGARLEGAFDLTFNDPNQSHVVGNFTTASCALTGAQLCADASTDTTCQ